VNRKSGAKQIGQAGNAQDEGQNISEQGGVVNGSKRTQSQPMFDFAYAIEGEPAWDPGRESPVSAPGAQPTLGRPHSRLMERIVSSANLTAAWKKVKANRGAPGIDGMKVEELASFWEAHGKRIRASLLDGTYEPSPVRRKVIPKSDGGERLLGIPTVLDRLVQQAALQVLGPMFDPGFSESSFGFRPGRSAHGALKQVKRYVQQGYGVAIDMDLSKFFDRVQHDVLMHRVARKVDDRRVLKLIGRYLRAGVRIDDYDEPTEIGTPQGGPLSPLLANVLLDDLDKELEGRGLRFARYADDFIILVRTWRAARRVKASITRWIERRLKLVINEQKSQVAKVERCSFLGFLCRRGKIWFAPKALVKFKGRTRELTGRSRGISMERRLEELNRYLRGWINYFGLVDIHKVLETFDAWIRRRLRACYWKQWKRPKTRIRNLMALGAPRAFAITTGVSRKGPWRLSKTLGTHAALNKKWFQTLGLVSLKDEWERLAPRR
jgi:RNA-directed DNA polymerase